MNGIADEYRWTPAEGIHRLRMAADRLCPECVLGGARSDADGGGPAVTLPRAVALCEGTDLDPAEGDGQFVLVLGIRHEIRKRLLVLAGLAGRADRAEIEHDAQDWLESQKRDVENDIAEWWGEPVADLIRQEHDDHGFFDRILVEYRMDAEPCRNVDM